MKRETILVSFCVAACCMVLSFFYVGNMEERLRVRIKREVKEEMSREIRLALATAAPARPVDPVALDKERASESLAAQRLASTREMDFYVAGAVDTPVTLSGGMTKDLEPSQKKDSAAFESVVAGKAVEGAVERTLVEKGGMLLPKGKMQIEPSFTVAHFSSNRVNIQGFSILTLEGGGLNFGLFSTESVKRDVFIPAVTFRRGLLRNFQGEVKIPFRYEYDRVTSNVGAETNRYDYGLGDIELTLSRQLFWERGIIPDTVASFTVKTPSAENPYGQPIGLGTGHWGFRGALVAVKSSDPAVVFGSVNYTHNLPKNVDLPGYGEVDPGDSIGWSLGAAIGLSYQTAINFAFEQNVTYKVSINGHNVKGSFLNACDLKTGFTWAISERASLNFSVSLGLTTDAPDYVAEVSLPYTF